MHESLPKQERLERAKKRLTEILEEVLLWLDDAREDTCYEQLFDYSLPAAELAAILGFGQPPFEHVAPSQFGSDCQVGNWQANTHFQTIRVNAPVGMSRVHFRVTESLVESLVSVASPRFYGDMRSFVMRWMRALSRLDIREVKLPECVFAMYDESAEAVLFQEQHERELRGDTRSFLQDVLTESFEGVRLAKLHNLSPEQTTLLMRAMGRSWADAHPSNQPASAPRGEPNVKSSGGTRSTSEVHVTAAEGADTPTSAKAAAVPHSAGVSSVGPPRGMSRAEANRKARELMDKDADFRDKGQREWAEAIGCSVGLVAELPTWRAVMEETGRSRKTKAANASVRPKAVSLTSTVLAVNGEDQDPSERAATDEIMRELIEAATPERRAELNNLTPAERRKLVDTYSSQQRDAEPSPLDEDPPDSPPTTVRERKQL